MVDIIKFGNKGTLDPLMWTTFGVNVKGGPDAIGQFGTGLKYAIAVLIRNERKIWITVNDTRYEFASSKTKIRGEDFEVITCNGDLLPYTTHLGSNWELWQAYRELYSNCLDEGGDIDLEGETIIHAELGDIAHDEVFLTEGRRLLAHTPVCDVYAGSSPYLFYKGIRAGEVKTGSLFTYDIKQAELTEDRTFKYNFQVASSIGRAVLGSDNEELAQQFLLQSKDLFESKIDIDCCSTKPSQTLLNLVSRHHKDNVYMHEGVKARALSILGESSFTTDPMNELQEAVITKAKKFCSNIGYDIDYPIHMSRNLGRTTLAVADRRTNTIYLSDTVLSQGTKQVVATLIEEYLHLAKGLDDCTYQMQSYLFDQIVTMSEKLTGEVL